MGLHGMPKMRILSFTTEGIISSLQVLDMMIFCATPLGRTRLFDQTPDATLYSPRVIAYCQRLLHMYTIYNSCESPKATRRGGSTAKVLRYRARGSRVGFSAAEAVFLREKYNSACVYFGAY